MRRERACKGCDGTGRHADIPGYVTTAWYPATCLACLGTGRVTDHIPAADAVADAETLRAELSVYYDHATGEVVTTDTPERMTAHLWFSGLFGDYAVNACVDSALRAARQAFAAVPGLREENRAHDPSLPPAAVSARLVRISASPRRM